MNGVIKSAKAGQKNKLFYRFNQEGKGQLFSFYYFKRIFTPKLSEFDILNDATSLQIEIPN